MAKLEVKYSSTMQGVEVFEYIPGAGSENSRHSVISRLSRLEELNALILSLQRCVPQMRAKEEALQLKVRDERIKRREELKAELQKLEALIDPGSPQIPVVTPKFQGEQEQ